MDGALVAAGVMALGAAGVHGILGDQFLRKIGRDVLPVNALGGSAMSRMLVRVSWHLVTVAFAISGMLLLAVGTGSAGSSRPGVVLALGSIFTGFALLGVAAPLARGNLRFFVQHPAPLGLTAISLLIWLGGRSG